MRPRWRPGRKALVRVAVAGVTAVLLTVSPAGSGYADTPTPAPSATPTPPSPSAAASTSPTSTTPTPTVVPPAPTVNRPAGSAATPTTDAGRRSTPQAGQAAGLTLTVRSTFGSGSSFWSDIGRYAFRGSASGLADRGPIEIYRRSSSTGWTRLTTARVDAGKYAAGYPVLSSGTFTFVA